MSDTPILPALLTPDRLAEIRQRYDDGCMCRDCEPAQELLAHLDAREVQVKQVLAGLRLHSLEKLPYDSPYRILGEACNTSVENAAKALNITL